MHNNASRVNLRPRSDSDATVCFPLGCPFHRVYRYTRDGPANPSIRIHAQTHRRISDTPAEDNPADVRLFREMCVDRINADVDEARDGCEAVDLLAEWRYDFAVLDLNVPKINGFAVLRYMRQSVHNRCTPAMMFTTSKSEGDVRTAYDSAASCYVIKPTDLHGYDRIGESLARFWFKVATLPT